MIDQYIINNILKYNYITLVGSWFVSPILAGIVSTSIFYICKYTVLNKV